MTRLGSNVDVASSPHELDQELKKRAEELDAALDLTNENLGHWKVAIHDFYSRHAAETLKAVAHTDKVTGWKQLADAECVDEKIELKIREGMRETYQDLVKSRLAQLSAAQSRASLLRAQMRLDGSSEAPTF